MTIAAAYLTSEGVVLGADSTTTVTASDSQGGQRVQQLLNHAQKVFEIGDPGSGQYAVSTWGAGTLGDLSHRTIIARANDQIPQGSSISDAIDCFCGVVQPEVDRALPVNTPVGYYFGGVNPADFVPECWSLVFTSGNPVQKGQLGIGEASFSGSPEFFGRVFLGFDPNLPKELVDEIQKELPESVKDFDQIFDRAFARVADRLKNVGYRDLPIREAIDYLHTYLHVTIKGFKFRFGAPPCGGPIEIGFISADRRFRWALHKPFYTAIREHEGGANV